MLLSENGHEIFMVVIQHHFSASKGGCSEILANNCHPIIQKSLKCKEIILAGIVM